MADTRGKTLAMFRILLTFGLTLLGGLAYADNGGSTTQTLASFFHIASDDQSLVYLGKIFGPVGNVLVPQNVTPHVLGHMFSMFNKVMLVLNVIVISYTTIFGMINTANEGEFLGKKLNSAWVPIRSVLGVGLLIPTTSGYCMLQILMMWLVMQGVGAADSVWNVVISSKVNISKVTNQNKVSSDLSKFNIASKLSTIVAINACRHYVKQYNQKNDLSDDKKISDSFCGTIKVPQDIPSASKSAQNHFSAKAVKEALESAGVNNLQAGGLLNRIGETFAKCKFQSGELPDECMKGGGNAAIFANLANEDFLSKFEDEKSNYFEWLRQHDPSNTDKTAKEKGWAYAGAFYHDIYDKGSKQGGFKPNIQVSGPQIKQTHNMPDLKEYIHEVKQKANTLLGQSDDGYPTMANLDPSGISHFQQGGFVGNVRGASTGLFDAIGWTFIKLFSRMLIGQDNFFAGGSGKRAISGNPITHLAKLGQQAIVLAEISMSWTMPMILILLTFANLCGSNCPGWGLFCSIGMFLFTGMLALFGMLTSFGLLTSVYIPLVPYIIFYFGVLGWLMAVIETMLAAPMVAMGIASPDGQHELLGRAEPAVMLVTNVFIRPTLMIFGLVAGFLLSLVGLLFLNGTYEYIVSASLAASMQENPDQARSYMGPLQWAGYIVVYISLVMALINKSYSMIHQIPDAVLRWIGGQGQFGEYAKGEDEVKSSSQQGMQPVSQVPSGTASQVGAAQKETAEKSAKEFRGKNPDSKLSEALGQFAKEK